MGYSSTTQNVMEFLDNLTPNNDNDSLSLLLPNITDYFMDNLTPNNDNDSLLLLLPNITDYFMDNLTTPSNMSSMAAGEYGMPDMPRWIPVCYLILLCVAVVVGIPGNLVTALAYFCVKVKTNCDWYIFFVATFDFISCTFRVTGYLLEFLGVWAQLTNTAYCLFVSWISQTSVGMSILIVGLIAIDRCIKVSFNSRMTITPTQSRNICLIFTAFAFVMGSPTLFIYGNTPRGICIVTRDSADKPWVQYYYSILFLLLFGMMANVIFCYLNIAWTVMKNRRVIQVMPTHSIHGMVSTSTSKSRRNNQHRYRRRRKLFPDILDTNDNTERTRTQCGPSSMTSSSLHCTNSNTNSINTLSIPQAPNLFVIPGPQTKVIFQPRAYHSRVQQRDSMEIINLEQQTERDLKDSDETMRNRIQFTKEQWNKRLARDYKVTGLLFLVTTVFIISWIAPCYATFRAFFVGITFPFTVAEAVTLIYAPNLYIINNFANPLIYLSLSSMYRKKVKYLYKRCRELIFV